MIKPDVYYFLEEQTPYYGDLIMFLSLMLQLALKSCYFQRKRKHTNLVVWDNYGILTFRLF